MVFGVKKTFILISLLYFIFIFQSLKKTFLNHIEQQNKTYLNQLQQSLLQQDSVISPNFYLSQHPTYIFLSDGYTAYINNPIAGFLNTSSLKFLENFTSQKDYQDPLGQSWQILSLNITDKGQKIGILSASIKNKQVKEGDLHQNIASLMPLFQVNNGQITIKSNFLPSFWDSVRGNNVLALTDSADLNNTTESSTVDTWDAGFSNTEGYRGLDIDNNGSNEYYYSEWNIDKGTYTINDFYEYTKFLTRDGSEETLYGLSGELFRGITHQVNLNTGGTNSGTFNAYEPVSWSGGTGQMLAIDNTTASSATAMWIQLLTGSSPGTGTLITGTTSSATATTTGSNASVERTTSKPFCGASTGSALIGAYGLGIVAADLSSSDSLTDLSGSVNNPPNYVTNTVAGLASGEDRVLVAPYAGSPDPNGDPAINKSQLSLATALTTDNVTSVVVTEDIPAYTPSSGHIRVTDNDGFERRLHYTSISGKTFTIDTTDGNEDFAAVSANIGNDIYIAYIDELADSSTASFTSVHGDTGTMSLVVIVRDGGGTPIKQYIAPWTQSNSNSTITVIRTSDT